MNIISASISALSGSSKTARVMLESMLLAKQQQPVPLDPDFPYAALPFERSWFSADSEHPVQKSES